MKQDNKVPATISMFKFWLHAQIEVIDFVSGPWTPATS